MTVLERLAAAGIAPARVFGHVFAGRVLLDGAPVTDPAAWAGPPQPPWVWPRLVITSGPGHVRPDGYPPPWTGPRGPQRQT